MPTQALDGEPVTFWRAPNSSKLLASWVEKVEATLMHCREPAR